MTFQTFGLHPQLVQNVTSMGYTSATGIQQQSIPVVMTGADLMACAQTGTGKTAAFLLPSLHRLLSVPSAAPKGRGPRLLVLTPTRELAAQVNEQVLKLSRGSKLRTAMVIGGVSYEPQIKALKGYMDILVATPGRLIDHMQNHLVDFSRVEVLVLDEADRMLDMGFVKPVEHITAAISASAGRPQTLMFSATFDKPIEAIARRLLQNPQRVELATPNQNHSSIEQKLMYVRHVEEKHDTLVGILQDDAVWQAIVFTATKRDADKLAGTLRSAGVNSEALHGDMRQGARKRTIQKMHDGKLRVLVATDVAARGIDVKALSHVVNYDLPQVAEDYVHRIGRTGRGGANGVAISLIGPRDKSKLRDIEKYIGRSLGGEGMVFEADSKANSRNRGGSGKRMGGGYAGGYSKQTGDAGRNGRSFSSRGNTAGGYYKPERSERSFAGDKTEWGARTDRTARGDRGDRTDNRTGGRSFQPRHSGGASAYAGDSYEGRSRPARFGNTTTERPARRAFADNTAGASSHTGGSSRTLRLSSPAGEASAGKKPFGKKTFSHGNGGKSASGKNTTHGGRGTQPGGQGGFKKRSGGKTTDLRA